MEDIRTKRLSVLIKDMIVNHSEEIDLNNTYELYDSLLNLTFSGEFDDIFLSDNLDGVSKEERKEIFELCRKYKSLCFYQGELSNWIDSVEGVTRSDFDLISTELLDSYDYLIRLAKDGGEDVLKLISGFQGDEMSKKGAIIALLRNSFDDDLLLADILIDMSREDGNYKDFTNEEKLILCKNPKGVLYKEEDGYNNIVDTKELKMKITKKYLGTLHFDVSNIDLESFERIVSLINSEYCEEKLGRGKR